WADEQLLLGENDWVNGGYKPNTSVVDLAHKAGVKILMSVGGWNHSPRFPAIAADNTKRAKMVSSIIELIKKYKFDGVDMDWEYPGDPAQGGGPADKENFTKLITELHTALQNLKSQTGKTYMLTSCFGADVKKMENIEWAKVLPYLDMVNLMTYDFFGAWDPIANVCSPLYPPEYGDPNFCVSSAFNNIVNKFHVPLNKLNLGVPFYGRALAGVSTLYGNSPGQADKATFPEDLGQPTYYNILKRIDQFEQHWDEKTQTPYLTKSDGFVSYDNPKSVGKKVQFAKDSGVAGVIIWEITNDMLAPDQTQSGKIETPLVDKVNQVFNEKTVTAVSNVDKATSDKLSVFPNPVSSNNSFRVKLDLEKESITSVSVYNTLGQKVMESDPVHMKAGSNEMNLQFDIPGTYIIRSKAGEKVLQDKLIIK
ncbi:MAG: glycosyl hydrolase family 18 protein, partial [Bacteroidales bacterium]